MTALNLASIPSNINTYERLAFWVMQTLQDIANGAEVNAIASQGSVPRVNVQLATLANGEFAAVLGAYIPVTLAEINSQTEKTWMAAQDISTAAPAATFLSN